MSKTPGIFLFVLSISHSTGHANPTTVAFANLEGMKPDEERKPVNIDAASGRHSFIIQQDVSRLRFQVDSPIGDVWVNIDDFSGGFSIHGDARQKNVAAIEVNADNLAADRILVKSILKGSSFLDVKKFPAMHFVGRSMEWHDEKHAVLKGYMTIKDTTRVVAFSVQLVDPGADNILPRRIKMKATTTIKRSEFGINALTPLVSDNVNLHINIEAVKESTVQPMMMMSAK